ncbi:hypothetical protein GCM10009665_25160 [Kitasatospora nipponensis]|uniref:Uncharacterized protein n=1 Tax=Kitasatospora nipponensis TaxID=258049 RepID=A0ABN1W3G0_9ACTN
MTGQLPDALDQRLLAELVPQCPALATGRRRAAAVRNLAAVTPDPRAAEHRTELLAALRPTTRTATPSPRESAA